jgi:hypothetical protein
MLTYKNLLTYRKNTASFSHFETEHLMRLIDLMDQSYGTEAMAQRLWSITTSFPGEKSLRPRLGR